MSEDTINKALRVAGIPDMSTFSRIFAVAAKANVFPGEVGKYCTKNRIRIRGCQPGCFP
jgi:hypothetical protein